MHQYQFLAVLEQFRRIGANGGEIDTLGAAEFDYGD